MTFITNDLSRVSGMRRVIGVHLTLTPRSCSMFIKSVYLSCKAMHCYAPTYTQLWALL